MVTLIIYAIIAAGALFVGYKAWDGFKTSIAEPYVQAQMKHDQATVDTANAAQKAAEAERDHAKADTASCVAMTQVQNDEIAKWQRAASANAANAKAAKAQAVKDAAAAAPKIAELQAAAAAKPQLMSCQAELDKTKVVLKDALAARRQPVAPLPGAK